ncbi:MAG: hypothetical protein IKS85_04575, partial [Lachnospiraceae bacterium]|nr:hypothetical protein [Lachnospiraceae bacterium]
MSRRNSRKKQFNSIKKNHWGVSLILLAIVIAVVAGGFITVVALGSEMIFESKVKAAYEKAVRMACIYELLDDQERKENKKLKEASYYCLDADGKEIDAFGENTSIPGVKRMSGDIRYTWYDVCLDEDNDWLTWNEKGYYSPAFRQILKRILNGYMGDNTTLVFEAEIGEAHDEAKEDEDAAEGLEPTIPTENHEGYAFPLWFSIPILEGQETFVCKSSIEFLSQETTILVALYIFVPGAFWIVVLFLIINMIRSGARQKRIIDTYMTDPVTKCHNLSWFLLRQEPLLRSGRYKRRNFAVIEALFVNYRNFCTCHSLEEGEKMLRKVGEVITKQMEKQECCAHVATASFALLLKYENESQLQQRLKEMIGSMETIDPAHKFAFHFGVRLLEVQKKGNGRVVRRRNLNLEKEFNNACMARATLSDSDDSRIAFFDHQLVEEKKWIDAVTERQVKAIQKEEFEVYYQPKYDPKTRKLRGAEA